MEILARCVPVALERLVAQYREERGGGELFAQWVERADRDAVKAWLADLTLSDAPSAWRSLSPTSSCRLELALQRSILARILRHRRDADVAGREEARCAIVHPPRPTRIRPGCQPELQQ
jgi:hypothetical protein